MASSADPYATTVAIVDDVDENEDDHGDWEEWDGRSPFWAHCVAGSLAGVVEHAAIYPLDTVRTHIQVCAACIHRTGGLPPSFGVPHNSNLSSEGLRGAGHAAAKLASSATTAVKTPTSSSAVASAVAAAAQHQQQQQQVHRLPLGMMQTIQFLTTDAAMATTNDLSMTRPPTNTSTAANAAATAATSSVTEALTNFTRGWSRLFRGVQTILIGCIPAHALYFSSYETIKSYHLNDKGQVTAFGSSLSGAAAVTSHDLIMTPLDTLKQRLQIGHYNGSAWQAARAITQQEGFVALYRSFPITLASNIPYGMVMVSTHEACKNLFNSDSFVDHNQRRRPQWQVVLAASSVAGLVASAVTTPLDRIKTALQTQQLTPVCAALQVPCPLTTATASTSTSPPRHINWQQAALTIWKEEGATGFFRGMAPRILSHTPAVAISWTTYETAKHYLLSHH